MDSYRPSAPGPLPPGVDSVITPLAVDVWREELQDHPDTEYLSYILAGIEGGFRIGFGFASHSCRSAAHNIQSATTHPEPMEKYIREEVSAGHIIGPHNSHWRQSVHVSRFGVIPKPHQPGKWQLITDLSSARGFSVNDVVSSELCSLSYTSVDNTLSI